MFRGASKNVSVAVMIKHIETVPKIHSQILFGLRRLSVRGINATSLSCSSFLTLPVPLHVGQFLVPELK